MNPANQAAPPMRKLATSSATDGSVNVFACMEDIVDKLKILNYERDFLARRTDFRALTRTFFALPGQPSLQFSYFNSLSQWLLKFLQVDFLEWHEFDDPTSIINTIVDSAKRLGFSGDCTLSKLRAGWGESVCLLLDFLLDRALHRIGWQAVTPTHHSSASAEELPSDDAQDMGDEVEEEVAEDEEVTGGALASDFEAKISYEEEKEREEKAILESKVDPQEWRLELERVGPRLKIRTTTTQQEWRSHLEQSTKHQKNLTEVVPSSKQSLEKIGSSMRKAVDRIIQKEKHINKEYEQLGVEFREKHKVLEGIQEQYNTLSSSVSQLTQELQTKNEQVEAVKSQWTDRNNSMTDTTPLKTLQTALQQLRQEVNEMELRIGVVSQTLLTSQMKHHQEQNTKAMQQRLSSAGGPSGSRNSGQGTGMSQSGLRTSYDQEGGRYGSGARGYFDE